MLEFFCVLVSFHIASQKGKGSTKNLSIGITSFLKSIDEISNEINELEGELRDINQWFFERIRENKLTTTLEEAKQIANVKEPTNKTLNAQATDPNHNNQITDLKNIFRIHYYRLAIFESINEGISGLQTEITKKKKELGLVLSKLTKYSKKNKDLKNALVRYQSSG